MISIVGLILQFYRTAYDFSFWSS